MTKNSNAWPRAALVALALLAGGCDPGVGDAGPAPAEADAAAPARETAAEQANPSPAPSP